MVLRVDFNHNEMLINHHPKTRFERHLHGHLHLAHHDPGDFHEVPPASWTRPLLLMVKLAATERQAAPIKNQKAALYEP